MFGHDALQGLGLAVVNVPGENHGPVLHGGADAVGTSPVDRVNRHSVVVQRTREIQDLPHLVAIQHHQVEARSPEPREFLPVRGQNDLPTVNLCIQHRPTFLNLNGNYTGLPVFVHLCTLNPNIRLYSGFQQARVQGEQASLIRDGVHGLGLGVHAGAFDPHTRNGKVEVGDEKNGEGSSDGDGYRDQDRAQVTIQDWDPGSSSMSSRLSPTCEISPAPSVRTRSPPSEMLCRTRGIASCWGT